MTTVAGDLTNIALLIAEIPNYTDILKSKIAKKYTNIPTQHAAQEKFLLFDNLESYETRIHPLLLGVADSSIPDQISQTSAVNIQNKSCSDSSSIFRAELDSMIKLQLALVPTSSIQVPDKYMPERPPDKYDINSKKFIHLSDMFSAKPVQLKKNIEVDSNEELADHMGKLSINKALSKGFEAGVYAISKSSKHCCSNCNRTRHNSQPTPEIFNSDEDETLDDPMKINFVCQKEPDTGIVTIPCKIKYLKILAMILDSGAETEIVTEDIVKHINGKIDRSVKFDLSSIATIPIESIVMKNSKPMLLFSNQLLKKYECVKNKLEVNYATVTQDGSHNENTITSKPLVSGQISQKVDSDKND
ncbi:684_t:CDS:2, partial [Cetraspora pellucida]